MKKLVITGMPRSGGSVTARLFDGHPAVVSYPWSPRFGQNQNFLLVDESWSGSCRKLLEEAGVYNLFKSVVAGEKSTKGEIFTFRDDWFLQQLEETPIPTDEPLGYVDTVSRIFFESCEEFSENFEDKDIICWHATNHHFGNLVDALKQDANLYVIHLLRHPFDNFASFKSEALKLTYRPKTRLNAGMDAGLFNVSLLHALQNHEEFGDRYQIIRYEDLVQEPEVTLHSMIKHLDIEYHETLLYPTILGQSWKPNTFFSDSNRQTVERIQPLPSKYKTMLHPKECDLILEIAGKAMAAVGYTDDNPIVQPLETLPSPSTLGPLPLLTAFAQYYDLYKRRIFDWEYYYPQLNPTNPIGRYVTEDELFRTSSAQQKIFAYLQLLKSQPSVKRVLSYTSNLYKKYFRSKP